MPELELISPPLDAGASERGTTRTETGTVPLRKVLYQPGG
jgi:hypothetical protein